MLEPELASAGLKHMMFPLDLYLSLYKAEAPQEVRCAVAHFCRASLRRAALLVRPFGHIEKSLYSLFGKHPRIKGTILSRTVSFYRYELCVFAVHRYNQIL